MATDGEDVVKRGKRRSRNGRRKRCGGRARLECNVKRQSLGAEWSMSKVGIPPPHDSNKSQALVEGIKQQQQKEGGLSKCPICYNKFTSKT